MSLISYTPSICLSRTHFNYFKSWLGRNGYLHLLPWYLFQSLHYETESRSLGALTTKIKVGLTDITHFVRLIPPRTSSLIQFLFPQKIKLFNASFSILNALICASLSNKTSLVLDRNPQTISFSATVSLNACFNASTISKSLSLVIKFPLYRQKVAAIIVSIGHSWGIFIFVASPLFT